MVSKKRIYYLFKDGIEKNVTGDYPLSLLGKPMMPNSDPQEEFFFTTLTTMIYSYSL